MKLLPLLLTLALLTVTVSNVSASVYIFTDKDSVNLGDTIKIQVIADSNFSDPFEILVEGMENVEWLCKSDSGGDVTTVCGKNEWFFTIPHEWEEGTYLIKVLIDAAEPVEYFRDFKVIKPKILEVNLPNFVYQGKTKIDVKIETANITETSINVKLRGNNIDFFNINKMQWNKSGENEYLYSIELNLRAIYEQGHNFMRTLQPGKYLLEIKLFYRGKSYDSRSYVVEIHKPEIIVDVQDEITPGNPIIVKIKTNRMHDPGYEGIIVTLVGENYVVAKKVHLNEDGKGTVQFESGGLATGKYFIYVRDTCLTIAMVSVSQLATKYYDLQPGSEYSKVIQASDDVVVSHEIWILSDSNETPSVSIAVSPAVQESVANSSEEFKIVLIGSFSGINSYEFTISLTNDVAYFTSISLPKWASSIDRHITKKLIRIHAMNSENYKPDNGTVTLATITLKTHKPGSGNITLENVKIFDANGTSLDLTILKGRIIVSEPITVTSSNSDARREYHETQPSEIISADTESITEDISPTPNSHFVPPTEDLDLRIVAIPVAGLTLGVATYFLNKKIAKKSAKKVKKLNKRSKKKKSHNLS